MIQHFNNPLATNFLSVDHPLSDSYADLELGSVAYLLDAEMATLLLMASSPCPCSEMSFMENSAHGDK